MKAAALGIAWHPPRAALEPPGHGLASWWRRLRHGLGATRRSLNAVLAAAQPLIDSLRAADEASFAAALAAAGSDARLGRLRVSPREALRSSPLTARAQALALLAVACERSLDLRPYPEQLLAALAMHDGILVDMAQGEGKTLAVAMAAILHAWRGRPCHVATANDYLAQRDAASMRPLYARCGLDVAAAVQGLAPERLAEAYRADVVYAAGRQLLADFLRDQLILGGADDALRIGLRRSASAAGGHPTVMRGLYAVVVDDAETVMFDEAITPVIISAPSGNNLLIEAIRAAHDLVGHLQVGRDYRFLEGRRDIEFTAAGQECLERHGALLPPFWRKPERRDDLICQAIVVRDRIEPQRHYVVQGGRLSIVDDYIGRLLARPAWTQGLHQAIEIREGLEPTPHSRVLARLGFAPFFRRYHQLGGVGVGVYALRGEIWRSVDLLSLQLPARAVSALRICPPSISPDRRSKQAALVDGVVRLQRRGLPVLVSLRRLPDAEAIARQLAAQGVGCQLASIRQPTDLAQTLGRIAEPGQVTLALNMDICGMDLPPASTRDDDGRRAAAGVPSPAGGSADVELESAGGGGVRILQFDTQELARNDRRILNLAGRRGQPALARQYLAADDDLLRYHLPGHGSALLSLLGRRAPGLLSRVLPWMFRYAQYRAQSHARRQRLLQPRRETVLNQQLAFAGEQDMDVGVKQFRKHQKD